MATAIHLLREKRLSVIILSKNGENHTVGEVLAPVIKEELVRLGLFNDFLKLGSIPSSGISIWWGGPNRRERDYIFDPHGTGWHIQRNSFEKLLSQRAKQLGALIIDMQTIQDCSIDSSRKWNISARTTDGTLHRFSSLVLVNAIGRSGQLSNITGKKTYHDQLIGCYQYIDMTTLKMKWENRLWIEATPNGWFYTAPLPKNKGIAVFLTDSDIVGQDISKFVRLQMSDAPNTLMRLADVSADGDMKICSARSGVIPEYPQVGALTVGDASFTTDPIRGHGLLQAFRQAWDGSRAIVNYLNGNQQAFRIYNQKLREQYIVYQSGLFNQYMLEPRWHRNLFWARRTTT